MQNRPLVLKSTTSKDRYIKKHAKAQACTWIQNPPRRSGHDQNFSLPSNQSESHALEHPPFRQILLDAFSELDAIQPRPQPQSVPRIDVHSEMITAFYSNGGQRAIGASVRVGAEWCCCCEAQERIGFRTRGADGEVAEGGGGVCGEWMEEGCEEVM